MVKAQFQKHNKIGMLQDIPRPGGGNVRQPAVSEKTVTDELGSPSTPRQSTPKTIRAREFLCVKHAVPKTNVSKVILYENTSQERHLDMEMRRICRREEMFRITQELQRKKFIDSQENKHKKWRREDEIRLNGMNLPHMVVSTGDRVHSGHVMYTNPDYTLDLSPRGKAERTPPLPPLLNIDKEKTEIVFHRDKTFITKLPQTVNVNPTTLEHHMRFCGGGFMVEGQSARDERFQKLTSSLQKTGTGQSQTWRPLNAQTRGKQKSDTLLHGKRKCSWCRQQDIRLLAKGSSHKHLIRSNTDIADYGRQSAAMLGHKSKTTLSQFEKSKDRHFAKAIPGLAQTMPPSKLE